MHCYNLLLCVSNDLVSPSIIRAIVTCSRLNNQITIANDVHIKMIQIKNLITFTSYKFNLDHIKQRPLLFAFANVFFSLPFSLQVFCDKGAERKARDEERRASKRRTTPSGKRRLDEMYHTPLERSEFYSMADCSRPPVSLRMLTNFVY